MFRMIYCYNCTEKMHSFTVSYVLGNQEKRNTASLHIIGRNLLMIVARSIFFLLNSIEFPGLMLQEFDSGAAILTVSLTQHEISQSTIFLWPVNYRIRTESKITLLSLYWNIKVRKNPYFDIFYTVPWLTTHIRWLSRTSEISEDPVPSIKL